jgi:hypothetical protein
MSIEEIKEFEIPAETSTGPTPSRALLPRTPPSVRRQLFTSPSRFISEVGPPSTGLIPARRALEPGFFGSIDEDLEPTVSFLKVNQGDLINEIDFNPGMVENLFAQHLNQFGDADDGSAFNDDFTNLIRVGFDAAFESGDRDAFINVFNTISEGGFDYAKAADIDANKIQIFLQTIARRELEQIPSKELELFNILPTMIDSLTEEERLELFQAPVVTREVFETLLEKINAGNLGLNDLSELASNLDLLRFENPANKNELDELIFTRGALLAFEDITHQRGGLSPALLRRLGREFPVVRPIPLLSPPLFSPPGLSPAAPAASKRFQAPRRDIGRTIEVGETPQAIVLLSAPQKAIFADEVKNRADGFEKASIQSTSSPIKLRRELIHIINMANKVFTQDELKVQGSAGPVKIDVTGGESVQELINKLRDSVKDLRNPRVTFSLKPQMRQGEQMAFGEVLSDLRDALQSKPTTKPSEMNEPLLTHPHEVNQFGNIEIKRKGKRREIVFLGEVSAENLINLAKALKMGGGKLEYNTNILLITDKTKITGIVQFLMDAFNSTFGQMGRLLYIPNKNPIFLDGVLMPLMMQSKLDGAMEPFRKQQIRMLMRTPIKRYTTFARGGAIKPSAIAGTVGDIAGTVGSLFPPAQLITGPVKAIANVAKTIGKLFGF